jgi:hypothetical protein
MGKMGNYYYRNHQGPEADFPLWRQWGNMVNKSSAKDLALEMSRRSQYLYQPVLSVQFQSGFAQPAQGFFYAARFLFLFATSNLINPNTFLGPL